MPDLLAFDFGLCRIGVAVGQTITRTANPIEFLRARDGIPDWEDIAKLIQKWQPDKILVGIPLTMEDEEQHLTHCARKFANRLKEKFGVEIETVDERLTTKDARARMFDEGGFGALKKGKVDSVAAAIMLEDWFLTH